MFGLRAIFFKRTWIKSRLRIINCTPGSDFRSALQHTETENDIVGHFQRIVLENGIGSRGNARIGKRMHIIKADALSDLRPFYR